MKRPVTISFLLLLNVLASQTTITLTPSQDAAIGFHDGANTAGNNYGSAIQNAAFWVPSAAAPPPGVNGNRALIEFNLASIPAGATVISAYLNLYATGPVGSVSGHLGTNNACYLERITQSWQEFTATWNNQPGSTPLNSVILNQSSSPIQNYLNINVLPLVMDMINNPATSFGFKLKLVNESVSNGLLFCSKEHPEPGKPPALVITYSGCYANMPSLTSPGSICSGNPVVMTASGAGSNAVLWYPNFVTNQSVGSGSIFTTPTLTAAAMPVVYTYYAYLSTCTPKPREAVSVTVNPLPNVAVSGEDNVICPGQTTTLNAIGALTYTWTLNNQSTSFNSSLIINPATTTNYYVTGANGYGCAQTANFTQIVSACTGIQEKNMSEAGFSVFPNPSSANITVELNFEAGHHYALSIEDINGKLLFTCELKASVFEVKDLGCSSGIYFCKLIRDNNRVATKKLVVQ